MAHIDRAHLGCSKPYVSKLCGKRRTASEGQRYVSWCPGAEIPSGGTSDNDQTSKLNKWCVHLINHTDLKHPHQMMLKPIYI
jgi:hypothetical protein